MLIIFNIWQLIFICIAFIKTSCNVVSVYYSKANNCFFPLCLSYPLLIQKEITTIFRSFIYQLILNLNPYISSTFLLMSKPVNFLLAYQCIFVLSLDIFFLKRVYYFNLSRTFLDLILHRCCCFIIPITPRLNRQALSDLSPSQ